MRYLLALLFVSAVLCLGARAVDSENNQQTKVERTTNREKDWIVEFFKRSVLSLSIDETGAHFQVRRNAAKFRLGELEDRAASFKFQFTLSKPGEAFYSPDKHCLKIFCVKRITADSLLLDYTTTCDYRSAGKNLITEDRGQIELHPFSNP